MEERCTNGAERDPAGGAALPRHQEDDPGEGTSRAGTADHARIRPLQRRKGSFTPNERESEIFFDLTLIFDTGRYEQCVNFFKNLPASDISFTFTFTQCRRT